ncbi:hypothetical protein [Epilithonimonas hungarica]|uniref:Uncharacterized protein n=1 Tax=Epilithonimonas hungarica TaxID=454006 RepID=A0A1G7J2J8_9FLAO|nr:hypothetical protein [Epilithonimonas hungarica]SDF19096.1 hypothetical protein SAMN05421825_1261 [Epilithonimonas hungarica]
MNNELTKLEFNAYQLIKKFASERNGFFELTQIENGYDLKNQCHHFKIIKKNQTWYLVVLDDEKEYFFDGTNENTPFRYQRTYIGDWDIHFKDILGK